MDMQDIRAKLEAYMCAEELPFPVQSLAATLEEDVHCDKRYQDLQLAQALVELKTMDLPLFLDACTFFDTHLSIDLNVIISELTEC